MIEYCLDQLCGSASDTTGDSSWQPCHHHRPIFVSAGRRAFLADVKTMVLKLREILIKQVAIHLPYFSHDACQCLTAQQRERVLRWLASHDYLLPGITPYITRNLLAVPLYSLEFYKCNQLTNDMLTEIGRASHFSRLKSLIIHQCNQVHGRLEV